MFRLTIASRAFAHHAIQGQNVTAQLLLRISRLRILLDF
jgi:hypothetical protein